MRNERGFSLVEALVALTLLSLGSLLFAQASLLALKTGARSRRDARALALASEYSDRLRALSWERATDGCTDPDGEGKTALCTIEEGGGPCFVRLERSGGRPVRQKVSAACGREGREVILETAMGVRP
jgi:prepilin-type N-terminal cleavage/methylation domain-containing protein